jgi:predicted metal-dependent HD superfamily phosphohydrolase
MIDFVSVEKYTDHLLHSLPAKLFYHNATHAHDVCDAALKLGEKEGVSEDSLLLLKTAALFHDMGYLVTYHDNEKDAVKIIRKDLPGLGYSNTRIQQIASLILATRMPQKPKNKLQKILCDADLGNLGRNDFLPNTKLIWKEMQAYNVPVKEREWYKKSLQLLENHHYHTPAARALWDSGKKKNLTLLKRLLREQFSVTLPTQRD